MATGRSPSFGKPDASLSISELASEYNQFVKRYHGTGENSEYHRLPYALGPLVKLYGKSSAGEFGPAEFKAVRQAMIDHGLTRSGINAHMKRIVRMFRWAVSEGKLPAAIPQALAMVPSLRLGKTEAKEAPPVLPADDALVDATVKHLSPVVADMVALQRLTGMRPGELVILRPCDVDRSGGDVWVYRPSRHKTEHHGHGREVFIGPRGQEILLRYLARDSQAFCFAPRDSVAKQRAAAHAKRTTPMSCGNKPGSNVKRKPRKQAGDRYNPKSYARAVAYACKKAFPQPKDLKGDELAAWQLKYRWSPNQLRHSAGTRIRKQFGLEAAQVALGHSSADVTQVYAERDMAKGIEVARMIG